MGRLHVRESWLLLALGLVLAVGAPCTAAIVDVSGIEVPPVNGPVCVDGCDNTPATDPGPAPGPVTIPQPQPQPNPQPNPPPTPQPAQPVDPAVLAQQQFDREKQALMDEFKIPDSLAGVTNYDIPADSDAVVLSEDTVFGVSSMPTGLGQIGGLSADEWNRAGEAQRQMDALYAKWPLSAAESVALEQAENQRNSLWKKAISVPGLTAEERERLRLEFHVRGQRAGDAPLPSVTTGFVEKWTKAENVQTPEPTSSKPAPEAVNPLTSYLMKESLINKPTAGIEYIGEQIADVAAEDAPFGNVLGLAKVPVAYATEGQASARAAAADFLVGLIPYPQASFAVDGGRVYAKVAFQSLNKFMTDAMKATGADFDKEQFWSELKGESSKGMQGLMEWIGNGAD